MQFNTKLLHGSFEPEKTFGSTTTPIYQSTSFAHQTAEELENVFKGQALGFTYSRINNPTIESFEKRVALLEKGTGAIAASSGMAAISLAVLNICGQGDQILSSSGIFGGTYTFFKSLNKFGIEARFAEDFKPSSFEALINEKTKLIFVETISNPRLDVADIKELAELAHAYKMPLIVDNTVTSPYMIRPLEHGADIVIHSTSKLINGSGNSIGGIIIDKGKFAWTEERHPQLHEYRKKYGPFGFLVSLRKGFHRDMGATMAPFNAYLNSLGLETLGLRVEKMCQNAMELAEFLHEHPLVSWVNYPGLKDSPSYELASRQFEGKFGIMLTFGAGSKGKSFKVINNLKYAYNVSNVGDLRTLVVHPASTIYADCSPEERELMGVKEDLIRVSVGIEDIEDLKEDFGRALEERCCK